MSSSSTSSSGFYFSAGGYGCDFGADVDLDLSPAGLDVAGLEVLSLIRPDWTYAAGTGNQANKQNSVPQAASNRM
jgi:hypothetical protein